MGLIRDIGNALGRLLGGVDELVTSDEERGAIRARITTELAPLVQQAITYETELMKARSAVIQAEVASNSFLARNWRPFSMIVLLALVVVSTIIGKSIPNELWTLFQIGFGGYIGGRTVEKVAPSIVQAIKTQQ